MKKIILLISLALAIPFMTGCETLLGYRKSAGGQTSNKTVKVYMKDVTVTGNVTLDLDDAQSSVGDADQGGTAEGAVSPADSLNGNTVDVKPTP